MQKHEHIDHGKGFDWGRTSGNYAKYRDIYPKEFYQKIWDHGLCLEGQTVLDIGTGTGVLPRNLYARGANFTGIDVSQNQITQAIKLSKSNNMNIDFQCISAEKINFPNETFDIVTACQCFTYFDHTALSPHLSKLLKPDGKFAVLYMAWLPYEDKIAGNSEKLILKYNPSWTGCGETRHVISIPDIYSQYFTIESQEVFDVPVSFTKESWHGRIKTCRGIEASLSEQEIRQFDAEHMRLLNETAPQSFEVLHYAAITILAKKDH